MIFFVTFYLIWVGIFIYKLPHLIKMPDKFELFNDIVKTIVFGILLYFSVDDYKRSNKNQSSQS